MTKIPEGHEEMENVRKSCQKCKKRLEVNNTEDEDLGLVMLKNRLPTGKEC